jgi:hypothetical protein
MVQHGAEFEMAFFALAARQRSSPMNFLLSDRDLTMTEQPADRAS